MNARDKQHRAILQRIAQRAMIERGLLPDFSVEAQAELAGIQGPAPLKLSSWVGGPNKIRDEAKKSHARSGAGLQK